MVPPLLIAECPRIHHPFLLSDNRHYTFYVWRRIYMLHPLVPYLLTPAYLACAWAWFLRTGESKFLNECTAEVVDSRGRHRSDPASKSAAASVCCADAAAYASAGTAVLLDSLCAAAVAGERCASVGSGSGGTMVHYNQRHNDGGVSVPPKGRRRAVYVVDSQTETKSRDVAGKGRRPASRVCSSSFEQSHQSQPCPMTLKSR